jgi:hypothetical protein
LEFGIMVKNAMKNIFPKPYEGLTAKEICYKKLKERENFENFNPISDLYLKF